MGCPVNGSGDAGRLDLEVHVTCRRVGPLGAGSPLHRSKGALSSVRQPRERVETYPVGVAQTLAMPSQDQA
jgi:hypothetical protein